jgi:FkbM family methyltransferase
MILDAARFRHEYDLDALELIKPHGHAFEMFVTPRYRHLYGAQSYEGFTATLVRALSRSHELLVDIGAHYGFFSLVAASRRPEIEILACEPVPESHEILVRNLSRNGLSGARAIRRAVSDRSGVAQFNISLSSDNCSFYPHPVAPPIRQVEVETVTVDQLLAGREACPILLKMDTDGHELRVLAGMGDTFERFPELRLFVELNPKMQRLAGHEPDELVADLERRGFEVYLLDERERRAYRLAGPATWREVLRNPESYANLYCCRRDRSLSVAFFAHSSSLSGAERSLLELVTELVEDHGVVCTVVLPRAGPLAGLLAAAGAAVLSARYSWWCVSADQGPEGEPERDFVTWLGPSVRALLGEPLRELQRIDPHVVVTHTLAIPWGAIVAPILRRPHAWHVCEYGNLDHGFRFPVPFEEVVEILRASSNMVLLATDGLREHLFPGKGGVPCRTLYRHIEIPERSAGAPSSKLFTRPGAVRLAQLAAHAPSKGQDLVVQAVAQVVANGWDLELVLAGSGRDDFRAELSALIAAHGLQDRARLEGFIEDVYEAIRQTDIVVIGSRMEAFGRTAVEAMLLGKPVVYPEVGGYAEYMSDGETGLAYPVGDVARMAQAIETLVGDPGWREELGRRARAYARSTFTRARYGGVAYEALRQLRGEEVRIAPQWVGLLATSARLARDEALLWRTRHDRLREVRQELAKRISVAERRTRDLQQRLAEAEHRTLDLQQRLAEAEHRTLDLQQRLAEAEHGTLDLRQRLAEAERGTLDLRQRLSAAKTELSAALRSQDLVLGSVTWSIALWLRRPVDFLAPAGSRRRAWLRGFLRRIRNDETS